MERVVLWIGLLSFLLLAPTGCTRQAESTASDVAQTAADGATESPDDDEGPDDAVYTFLEAIRTGDDTKANDMLTQLAREKTAEFKMVVAPPGSETASFKVGEVEIIEGADESGDKETIAHVASTWTDIDDDGESRDDEIVWALRRDPEGWRVAGMATKIFDDEPPVIIDFEDPEDMQRKQKLAEDEMERRARLEMSESSEESDEPDLSGPDELSQEPSNDEPRREARQGKPASKSKRR